MKEIKVLTKKTIMKKKDSISKLAKLSGVFLICVGMSILFSSCEKKNNDDQNGPIVRGTDSYDIADASPQAYVDALIVATSNGEIGVAYSLIPKGNWYLDIPHSAVNWKTAYMGYGSFLTGKFSWFALKNFYFDEKDPSKIAFEAKVYLNSVVTSQPLRDDGCLLTTYKTNASYQEETANLATIKSTSASYHTDDAGYTVLADLTFLGVTRKVTMDLYYVGKQTFTTYDLISFDAEFPFNAISDFGLSATTVADLVTVNLNLNFKKSK
ncbi:MAG: hypothetical protein A2X05_01645 [Bacteroidetes bacterium GWE2_41_25]|nr:MAG: hypothetical protein A2X03_03385 [Bacteroidetes bacterium GWA2_40_15]OFX98029.1 MAG: hypothetical protein A2X06_11965 [Bacteroidetes bacterium GWC2_40_22]OFY09777.1 MAG: hypothetical protein A2X05_01645 [Bacteroidetes bacterium GWE2_41_25]OFY57760.1 MAG: hypothetical protein A2X04_11075 [Bacteroidetes bacterium GWF2_41_9]HBH83722.1 hypothetical protein [Bacteroidales bacterium]